MKAGLIAYLLKLLEGDSLRAVKNAPSVKAQIVKALKAMMRSLEYGEQVTALYWQFVFDTNVAHYALSCSLFPNFFDVFKFPLFPRL